MTEILYHEDSYLRDFQAIVEKVEGTGLVLDRTAFYPGGGGQPSDAGFLWCGNDRYQVVQVKNFNGDLLHTLDREPPVVKSLIQGQIDWERRYQLMRTHSALHILCGVVWRDYGAHVTGGNMQPLQARMDFELEHISTDFVAEIETKVNAEVDMNRTITTTILSREKAMVIPDLIRTKINLLPEGIANVRVVDIQGLDLQADGGTHVGSTGEVGRIKVVGHESKGRINKRIRIEIE
ncbi:alanyl-tRNA editing protein [SAR202 cluster bacterium AD-802-E10_MRT_200m]|nr:alanyl-tRNA editing protein [SAR202 cluster bacterium AD-802-E10_MRT_200m]